VRLSLRLLRTASFRFAALYVFVFAISALLLGGAVFLAARSSLERQMTAAVETEIIFLREEYRRGGLDRLLSTVEARSRDARALNYLVQGPDGLSLGGGIPPEAKPEAGWHVLAVPDEHDEDNQSEEVLALTTRLSDGLWLVVGDDRDRITEVEGAVAGAFVWTVGLAAFLGIGGGILLSRAFLARVDAIARTAEAIIGGDLARRIPVRGAGDDLDRLAGTLNHMLDRISALMDSLRQVSSDVAHDLRTPLSRLYQRLEDARDHARSVPDYEHAIDGALREAEGLLETFSALLRISQVEGASPRAGFRHLDFSVVADSIADAYRPDAEDGGRRLVSTVEAGIGLHGDQELLTQALANLVENAMRHTPTGSRIELRLFRRLDGGSCLIVQDDGPGVLAEDLSRLTHRFYRGERSRTTPGNGLGLSLVAAVAELHGAALSVTNSNPGLRVALSFTPEAGWNPQGRASAT
jgi:signal transduction histidine kinase